MVSKLKTEKPTKRSTSKADPTPKNSASEKDASISRRKLKTSTGEKFISATLNSKHVEESAHHVDFGVKIPKFVRNLPWRILKFAFKLGYKFTRRYPKIAAVGALLILL